ncbi:MAG TPA: VOC family protein [Stellaceae bacterium]|nr:VOC family protein [Stellaceae bacterium]
MTRSNRARHARRFANLRLQGIRGERQHVNHLALPVDTLEEFDAAYRRLKDHGVAVTEIIERGYGKTFYFHDPNGIRLQIELKTKQDTDSLEGDRDPVPYVRALLKRA